MLLTQMLRYAFGIAAPVFLLPLTAHTSAAAGDATTTPAEDVVSQRAEEVDPVPQLLENLSSDDANIAVSAARSLGVIFTPDGDREPRADRDEVAARLIDGLAARHGGPMRRESAIALGRMQAEQAVEPLQQALNDEDVQVAITSAGAIANILPVDDARTYLQAQVTDDATETVRAACYDAMAGIAKPEDKTFLIAGLSSDNWRVQGKAIEGLERAVRAGARIDAEIYDQVAAVLGNEMVNAANAAFHFLTHIRNDECRRVTVAAVETYDDDDADESWRTRAGALRVLRHIGWSTARDALPVVIRQLGDRTANVQNEARAIISYLRTENLISQDELYGLLLTELETAEPLKLRAVIMREMGGHVADHYASRVAVVAAQSLDDSLGEDDAWVLRASSINLLAAAGYTGQVETIAHCLTDDVTNVYRAAGSALQRLGPQCTAEQKAVVAALLADIILQPLDWHKTAVAAGAAGEYPAADLVEPLVRVLGYGVLNVREASSRSLVKFVRSGDAEIAELVSQYTQAEMSDNSAAWEQGARVLGALREVEGIPLLKRVLAGDNWRAQANAAAAVAEIAEHNKLDDEQLDDLLIRASQSSVLQVQDAANRALRELAQ